METAGCQLTDWTKIPAIALHMGGFWTIKSGYGREDLKSGHFVRLTSARNNWRWYRIEEIEHGLTMSLVFYINSDGGRDNCYIYKASGNILGDLVWP